MTLSPHALSIAVAVPLIVLMYYRRFRRSFGRQPVQPARMITRVVILCVVGALLLVGATLNPMMLAADVGGLVVGLALGWWGLKLTRLSGIPMACITSRTVGSASRSRYCCWRAWRIDSRCCGRRCSRHRPRRRCRIPADSVDAGAVRAAGRLLRRTISACQG